LVPAKLRRENFVMGEARRRKAAGQYNHHRNAGAGEEVIRDNLVVLGFEDLKRRADAAAVFLQANEFQFEQYWVPVLELTFEYTKQAWKGVGEPKNLDGTPNYNSKPLQAEFSRLLHANHPSWADWWMQPEKKSLRSYCRDIGEQLNAVLTWYRQLPDEQRAEWNHPRIVLREFQRAQRPTEDDPEPNRSRHEESIDDLEKEHAETVAHLHAEKTGLKTANTELKAVLGDVEKLAQEIVTRGQDFAHAVVRRIVELLHGRGRRQCVTTPTSSTPTPRCCGRGSPTTSGACSRSGAMVR
jgi:hypothetical protein